MGFIYINSLFNCLIYNNINIVLATAEKSISNDEGFILIDPSLNIFAPLNL